MAAIASSPKPSPRYASTARRRSRSCSSYTVPTVCPGRTSFLRTTQAADLTSGEGQRVYVEGVKLRWLLLGLVVVLLVVPAGTLTVARVLQPPGGAWVRLVAFTPYALALYVVALLLLLVAWGRGRGRWRPLARTFALAALAGALLHALWLAPAFVGATSRRRAGSRCA